MPPLTEFECIHSQFASIYRFWVYAMCMYILLENAEQRFVILLSALFVSPVLYFIIGSALSLHVFLSCVLNICLWMYTLTLSAFIDGYFYWDFVRIFSVVGLPTFAHICWNFAWSRLKDEQLHMLRWLWHPFSNIEFISMALYSSCRSRFTQRHQTRSCPLFEAPKTTANIEVYCTLTKRDWLIISDRKLSVVALYYKLNGSNSTMPKFTMNFRIQFPKLLTT